MNNAFDPVTLQTRGRLFTFEKPLVMGILNATADSFYDGGRYTDDEAIILRAKEIVEQGADIIDIGVVSTRPGAILLAPYEEAQRLSHVVRLVRGAYPDILISVDTCFSLPATKAVDEGADIINDISGGLFDERMLPTVCELQQPYILMHNRAVPSAMQQHTGYDDIIDDLTKFFSQKLDYLYRNGAKDVWLDPGFGFAKTLQDNHNLMQRLDELTSLFSEPMLVAISRKSMIYKHLGITANTSLNGTIALNTYALTKGASILRVHDVLAAVQTVNLLYNHHYDS